jgi:carbonic anhydrase
MNLHSFYKTALLASMLGPLIVPTFCVAQENHPAHWSYSGPENPKRWGKLDPAYSSCTLGRAQAPIDVKNAKPADLPALRIDYQSVPLNIIDNGHTIQVNYAPGSTFTVGNKTYTLKQFHFHHPAEEHINGTSFPLVAHLVHTDAEGHLAVIAVLFKTGATNPLIDMLWKNIPTEKEKAQDVPSVSVQAEDLLPRERDYFTFQGSLTTPPCSEGVTWYVLQSHTTISPEQVAAFAKIYPMNARPIQPTNGREILQSK